MLYCELCFSLIKEKCSSCKSTQYYKLDSLKTELQSLLSIYQNKENQNLDNLQYILKTILFDTTCFDETSQQKHNKIYTKLRKTIVKKQNRLFKSSDTKLYNVCQEIQSTLITLSQIYTEIQTCYHKSHNYKEIDKLIEFENTLNQREKFLKERESILEQQKNEFEQQKNEFEQRKNEFEQRKNEFEQRKNEFEQRKNEFEQRKNEFDILNKQIHIEIDSEIKRLDNLESEQKKILQHREYNLQKKEYELRVYENKLLEMETMIFDDMKIISKENNTYNDINFTYYKINNFLIFTNCLETCETVSIDNINQSISELETLLKSYILNFKKSKLTKLIPDINLQETYLITALAIRKFIGISKNFYINKYLENQANINYNLSNYHKITESFGT